MKAKQLAYEISGQLQVTVEADRDRLRQIIINLLHNSIQYTPPNGKVLIAWETTQDKLQISVSDSGIGIPHEDLPHVFERFFRVDRARSRQSGGTGLGLSITKHLVEMHKGHITVSSELERGSTFLITLPLKAYDHEQ
jgi:two-component system phosphate regulon sensor histidine kinase PhoR